MFRIRKTDPFISRLVDYSDQDEAETENIAAETETASSESETEHDLVIPENLAELATDDLDALHQQAVEAFDALYGDGQDISEESLEALSVLTEGIESVNTELSARAEKDAARAESAATLASRVRPEALAQAEDVAEDSEVEETEDEAATKNKAEEPEESPEKEKDESLVASGKRDIRVNLSSVRKRTPRATPPAPEQTGLTFATDGTPMTVDEMGQAVNNRLRGFNVGQYQMAARNQQHLRDQSSLGVIRKSIPDDLMIRTDSAAEAATVLERAVDQSRLPQQSLVASGGWCAPSQVTYDLLELESTDGLISLPEVGVSRGGLSFTRGPLFSDIYANIGFAYTEQEDIDGDYDGEGGGSKPCYKVDCPPFVEERMGIAGLCITAGLLQSRGYPEVIARTIRGALVAHEHKMAARIIQKMVADSTEVTMPDDQVGAIAPLLTAIELQTEHYRYVHRLARNTVVEGVFPFWVRGVVRSDLSRRLGIDLISVPDARINEWFRERNINPQFVYNYQDITGDAGDFTSWPTEVSFLLYAAGTWVRGTSDVITLDTVYDSLLLGTNDYTALFTEEGWMVMRRGLDSRVVTVNLCGDGATHAGVLIGCDGAAEAAA